MSGFRTMRYGAVVVGLAVLAALITAIPLSHPQTASAQGVITYQAGWNIIGVPAGTTLVNASGPLYTYRPGDTAYEVVPQGSALQSGWGYWAYFPTATPVTLGAATTTSVTVSLPPGQWVLIGNPGNGVATVSGAGVGLFTYTPGGSYQQASQLQPGQGAWAISFTGGTITISSGVGPPPPPPF